MKLAQKSTSQTFLLSAFCLVMSGAVLCPANAANESCQVADACERQDESEIRKLLNGQADVNCAQPDGMTALHWAAYHELTDVVDLLLDAGADVRAVNRYGVSPLSLACTNGNETILRSLVESGADVNSTLAGGETTLMTAARTGKVEPVRLLLEAGVDVDAKDRKKQTAIMWAAAEGHAAVVDELIKAGADFRATLGSGFNALFFAVREGRTGVVKVLLDASVEINAEFKPRSGNRNQRTNALLLAVENGHFETAAFLLDAGADPNLAPAGFTPLHALTWVRRPLLGDTDPAPIGSGNLNSLEFANRLIDAGANIDARYGQKSGTANRYSGGKAQFAKNGSTTFLMAARNSDLDLMHLLLDAGADWRLPNGDQCTALLAAAGVGALGSGDELPGSEAEAIEAVSMLLDLGAELNAVAEHGESAMHGAAYQERPELARFLVSRGADVEIWNRKNKFGWTPLLIAQGHRPGNFRPSPKTIAAIEELMRAEGLTPPVAANAKPSGPDYP